MTSLGGEQTVGDAAHTAVAVILGHRRERPLGPVDPEHAPRRDPPPATVLGRRRHGRVEAVDTRRRARRESDSHRSRRQMEHLDKPVGEFGPVLGHQPNLSKLSTARTGQPETGSDVGPCHQDNTVRPPNSRPLRPPPADPSAAPRRPHPRLTRRARRSLKPKNSESKFQRPSPACPLIAEAPRRRPDPDRRDDDALAALQADGGCRRFAERGPTGISPELAQSDPTRRARVGSGEPQSSGCRIWPTSSAPSTSRGPGRTK